MGFHTLKWSSRLGINMISWGKGTWRLAFFSTSQWYCLGSSVTFVGFFEGWIAHRKNGFSSLLVWAIRSLTYFTTSNHFFQDLVKINVFSFCPAWIAFIINHFFMSTMRALLHRQSTWEFPNGLGIDITYEIIIDILQHFLANFCHGNHNVLTIIILLISGVRVLVYGCFFSYYGVRIYISTQPVIEVSYTNYNIMSWCTGVLPTYLCTCHVKIHTILLIQLWAGFGLISLLNLEL